jgi:hypothetical protein
MSARKLDLMKLVLAGVVGLYFSFAAWATTPTGVQCPTAPVQLIKVAAKDCGCKVRAPKPGEKGFVQCRCAEKRSAKAIASSSGKERAALLPSPMISTALLSPSKARFSALPDWPKLERAEDLAKPPAA